MVGGGHRLDLKGEDGVDFLQAGRVIDDVGYAVAGEGVGKNAVGPFGLEFLFEAFLLFQIERSDGRIGFCHDGVPFE